MLASRRFFKKTYLNPMTSEGLALILLFTVAVIVPTAVLGLSAIIGRKKSTPEQLIPYECGIDPVGSMRPRLSVHFFLVAVLFIIFDVEVVFLYPWALVFRDFVLAGQGMTMFIEMVIFLGVLLIGFVYLWAAGALTWEDT